MMIKRRKSCMRKVIKKAGVFALIATLVLTGIALPVKDIMAQ